MGGHGGRRRGPDGGVERLGEVQLLPGARGAGAGPALGGRGRRLGVRRAAVPARLGRRGAHVVQRRGASPHLGGRGCGRGAGGCGACRAKRSRLAAYCALWRLVRLGALAAPTAACPPCLPCQVGDLSCVELEGRSALHAAVGRQGGGILLFDLAAGKPTGKVGVTTAGRGGVLQSVHREWVLQSVHHGRARGMHFLPPSMGRACQLERSSGQALAPHPPAPRI